MNLSISLADIDCILFDLDNTMYSRDVGLWRQIDDRIRAYISRFFDISLAEAGVLQKRYWLQYGTTIAGLTAEHGVEPGPYLDFVHDIDAAAFLQPNALLARMLDSLPQRKVIFTNATAAHARNVLSVLGVLPYFTQIIGVVELGYAPKPHPLAYERCLALAQADPRRCLFIEDSVSNLPPAQALGMKTVLIGLPEQGEADFYLPRIEVLGQLFGHDGQTG